MTGWLYGEGSAGEYGIGEFGLGDRRRSPGLSGIVRAWLWVSTGGKVEVKMNISDPTMDRPAMSRWSGSKRGVQSFQPAGVHLPVALSIALHAVFYTCVKNSYGLFSKNVYSPLPWLECDVPIDPGPKLRRSIRDQQLRPLRIHVGRNEGRRLPSTAASREVQHHEEFLVGRRVISDPRVDLLVAFVEGDEFASITCQSGR